MVARFYGKHSDHIFEFDGLFHSVQTNKVNNNTKSVKFNRIAFTEVFIKMAYSCGKRKIDPENLELQVKLHDLQHIK